MEDLLELADRFNVPRADVLLIALNAHGVRMESGLGRARCIVAPTEAPGRIFRTIVATGRSESPFDIVSGQLTLGGEVVGRVSGLEHDDARLGYFRDECRILTLNTNARSHCTGCVFCPNTGSDASDPRVDVTSDELLNWLAVLCERERITDLSSVEEVNLSTSCFGEEHAAIDHLSSLRRELGKLGFRGRLGILSSVVRTRAGLELAAERVGPFALFLTLECVTQRKLWLKDTKASLDAVSALSVLAEARAAGCSTGVTLVVGLDPLPDLCAWLKEALPHLTDFPNLQVFQTHSRYMRAASIMGDSPVEWFLEARAALEDCLLPYRGGLRPEHWQNYRPFWYTKFLEDDLCSPGTVMSSV